MNRNKDKLKNDRTDQMLIEAKTAAEEMLESYRKLPESDQKGIATAIFILAAMAESKDEMKAV